MKVTTKCFLSIYTFVWLGNLFSYKLVFAAHLATSLGCLATVVYRIFEQTNQISVLQEIFHSLCSKAVSDHIQDIDSTSSCLFIDMSFYAWLFSSLVAISNDQIPALFLGVLQIILGSNSSLHEFLIRDFFKWPLLVFGQNRTNMQEAFFLSTICNLQWEMARVNSFLLGIRR